MYEFDINSYTNVFIWFIILLTVELFELENQISIYSILILSIFSIIRFPAGLTKINLDIF